MILKNASHLPCFLVDFWAGEKFIHPLQFMLSKNKVQGFPFKAYRKNLIIKKERKNFVWCTMHTIWIVIASSFKHIKLIFNEIAFCCSYTLQKKNPKNKKKFWFKRKLASYFFLISFLKYVFPLYSTCNVSQNQSWNFTLIVRMQILEKTFVCF